MFTGIVSKASIAKIIPDQLGWEIVILSPDISQKVKLGDSIAVDGACLSVTKIENENISFYVSNETIDKTIIRYYQTGDEINVELPLQPTGYL